MRLAKSIFQSIGSSANHQIAADDPAAHVPIDHEGKSPEHLLLNDRVVSPQELSDTIG